MVASFRVLFICSTWPLVHGWFGFVRFQAQESGVFFTISRKQSSGVGAKPNGENVNSGNNRRTDLDALTALTNAVGAEPHATEAASDQNGQKAKLAFLQKGPDAEIYNKNAQ